MTTILIIGLLIPLLGTMLGSAFVFFMKNEMSARLQKSLLGFASGVMVAASVWSLLIPAMEMSSMENGQWIMDNEGVYDLQGRRVENPTKGLYIRGNKKVIIK